MQVGLAEQRAQEHAELAVKLEGIHQERMTLGGPSSMFSDNLIDLTDNVEDALGAAPTQGHSLHLFASFMSLQITACIDQGLSPVLQPSLSAVSLHSRTIIHQVSKLLAVLVSGHPVQ